MFLKYFNVGWDSKELSSKTVSGISTTLLSIRFWQLKRRKKNRIPWFIYCQACVFLLRWKGLHGWSQARDLGLGLDQEKLGLAQHNSYYCKLPASIYSILTHFHGSPRSIGAKLCTFYALVHYRCVLPSLLSGLLQWLISVS